MFNEIRLWWILRGKLKELGKMNLTLSVNSILQILLLISQGLNQAMDILSPKMKFWAMVAMSATQGLIAVLAHFVNPDGTSAKVAYIPLSSKN